MEEEIDLIEIQLNESEIDEVISHLVELKEHKTEVKFPLAADLDLHVKYDADNSQEELEETQ